jgi:tetratricopeptide (TPR) repeat protein
MLDNEALIEKALGRYDVAQRLSLEALTQYRRQDNAPGVALCLSNLAIIYMAQDHWESARLSLLEAIEVCERNGIVGTRALALGNLTEIAFRDRDLAAMEDYGTRALKAAETAGNRTLAAWMHLQLARMSVQRSELDHARGHLRDGLLTALATGRPRLQLGAVDCFGEILAAQAEPECARQVWRFAIEHPLTDAPEREQIRRRMADLPAVAGVETLQPSLELDALVQRIVAETGVAYGPLIAVLRGTAKRASTVGQRVS